MTEPVAPVYAPFEEMRRVFHAAGGPVYHHGMTLLLLVERVQKLLANGPPIPTTTLPPLTEDDFILRVDSVQGLTRIQATERALILLALKIHNGVVTLSTEWCGLGRQTFYNKIREYEIPLREKHDPSEEVKC